MGKPGLFLIVCALAVGGGVNYRRNAPLDNELASRPYAELSHEDIATLIGAYEKDVKESWSGDVPAEASARVSASDLGGKWQAFERFQKDHAGWNSRRQVAVDKEVMLEKLRQERTIREKGLDQPWRRVLQRVVTF